MSAFGRLKTTRLMGAVAERPVGRSPTAAQCEGLFALQIKNIAGGIRHNSWTCDQKRTVILHNNFAFRHR